MAKKSERTFKDGDVIFREGEASKNAFVLINGEVELTKDSGDGPLRLAHLSPGEMFGEMGVLDQSARSATAKAVGKVKVEVITREAFVKALREEPDMAMSVMGKLVERLRTTNDLLVEGAPQASSKGKSSKKKGGKKGKGKGKQEEESRSIWSMMARLFKRTTGNKVEIRIGPVTDANSADMHKMLLAGLQKKRGFNVRPVAKKMEMPEARNEDELVKVMGALGRRWLEAQKADLLIWGTIPMTGGAFHLRFVTPGVEDEDRSGYFSPYAILPIPLNFTPEIAQLLLGIGLANIHLVDDEDREAMIRDALPNALTAATTALNNLPPDMTTKERVRIQLCFANLTSIVASEFNKSDLIDVAMDGYNAVLGALTEKDAPLECAYAQRNLGYLLQARAEKADDPETWAKASDCFSNALREITRAEFPLEWAPIRQRQALALYRMDLASGETDLLKQAIAGFQEVMQVHTRTAHPQRWADAMNNLAPAAQLLGEHLRNPDVLEKAVDACRSVLDVRKKKDAPLSWASTQNNLGSALFGLGKMTKDLEALEAAAKAFSEACAVYKDHGQKKQAAVAERNLAKVEKILEEKGVRSEAKSREEDEAEAELFGEEN